jgi:TPR repeat protein
MNRVSGGFLAGAVGIAAMTGCASSPAAQPAAARTLPDTAARCSGTLGIEVRPLSRALRKALLRGAVVAEVLPDGPAAAAGVRANDIVLKVGSAAIGNDCEFIDAGFGRVCKPVIVVLLRAGAEFETTLTPADELPLAEKSCRAGAAGGCFRQAWNLWNRNRGTDRDRALELFETACRAGSGEACAHEGFHLLDRADRGEDARSALERACEQGSGAGCAHLAFLYATGKLVARDDRRATPLYVKACDLGDALGCYNVGLMADDGRGTPRDRARAAAAYGEACEMGSATACTNLGFLYEKGRAVPKDSAKAFAFYQLGCKGTSCQPSNLNGCLNVGRAYRDSIGVAADEARAAAIFEEACNRKPNREDTNAEEAGSRGCSLLGALYLAGDGIENLSKGRELSVLGCERGDSFGCFNAAAVFRAGTGVDADPAKAAFYLDRACQGGDGEGCHDLGLAYEKGTGVARDHRRAAELFQKACELGFEQACPKKKR